MIKFRQVLLAASIVSVAIFNGCSPKMYTTKYSKVPEVRLAKDVQSDQTIGGIKIVMAPLDEKEYDKSFYKQSFNTYYIPLLIKPLPENKTQATIEQLIRFYENLTPFSVTIINNTDHILRMKDARVVYVDPNSDEPVIALDKQTIKEDIKTTIPAYNQSLINIKNKIMATKGGDGSFYPSLNPTLEIDLVKAMTDILNQIKFINGFNMEIMPGMKTSGILMFPIDPIKISEGKVSFIDMTSKTDAAGNPIEKVRFDYKMKSFNRFWKVEPNTNSWVEIKEDEFNKGQTNPEKFYYDKTQKKWISGTPPKK